ncbi:MAG TPA: linear amide C-N hydrolase [Methanocorpusculum sp.]|nr:linear amide C-N hydrolase [Methanocorpusculum sp.]
MSDKTQENTAELQEERARKRALILIGILVGILVLSAAVIVLIYVNTTVPVTIIADYQNSGGSGVIQLEDVTQFNDRNIYALLNAVLQSRESSVPGTAVNEDACSCLIVSQKINNSTLTVLGRTLDYDVTDKPAWVFYVNAGDRLRSFNMGYLGGDLSISGIDILPSMEEIAETQTIPAFTAGLLSYIVTDAVNEKGLVIETHFRKDSSDELTCYGTNPASQTLICSALLPRYLIDRCADIDDVLDVLNLINVYTPHSSLANLHVAFGLMDATGRYGVLEFVSDTVVWHEGQPGHTNFWLDGNAQNITQSCTGLGRWNTLEAAYSSVAAEKDPEKAMVRMQDALKSVYTSQFFTKTAPDETTYDVVYDCNRDIPYIAALASELNYTLGVPVNESELKAVKRIFAAENFYPGKEWDSAYLRNPANRENIIACYNFVTHFFEGVPEDILIDKKLLRTSVFSYVTANTQPVLHVRFFEHDDVYTFGFDEEGFALKASV